MIGATLFSGIGAPEMAMPEWEWPWHAEIDKFPAAVMAARHPDSINLGDVTADDFCDRAAKIAKPDVLVFGSPCQDFSIAGKRLGLDGARGNLALIALGIVACLKPTWFVFENVPGLLSNWSGAEDGPDEAGSEWESIENHDFAAFLGAVDGIGYSGAWAVLDAQYRGVAQRRERVFFVGHSGDWRYPAAVLLEPESLCGDTPPRRETGEGVAPTLDVRAGRSGETSFHTSGGLIAPPISPALKSRDYKGPSSDGDGDGAPLIAHSLRAEGFDASEDGTGRGTPIVPVVEPYTLAIRGRGDTLNLECRQDGTANAILTPNGGRVGIGVGAIAFNARQDPDVSGDVTHPLGAKDTGHAIAFSCKDHGADCGAVSPTLRGMGHDGSHANAGGQVAVAFTLHGADKTVNTATQTDVAGSIRTKPPGSIENSSTTCVLQETTAWSIMPQNSGKDFKARAVDVAQPVMAGGPVGGNQGGDYIQSRMSVRRLTPRECERLQGFPDDYTLIPWRGKSADQCPDGPRYKALGNSMAVPVMRWILTRIQAVDEILRRAA